MGLHNCANKNGRPRASISCAMQNVRQCRDEELLDLAVALFGDLVERLALGLGAPDNAHNQGNKKNDAHDNSCGEEAGRIRGDVAHDGANAYE